MAFFGALAATLDKLAATFPALERVSCYATPINLMHKTVAELRSLRAKKPSLVYVGIPPRCSIASAKAQRPRPSSKRSTTRTQRDAVSKPDAAVAQKSNIRRYADRKRPPGRTERYHGLEARVELRPDATGGCERLWR